MEQLYDIYFAGQLVENFDQADVRKNLVKLFKVNDATLEKLFSGKPQAIKRGVDKPGAIKYKAAMARAGAVAMVKAQSNAKPAASLAAEDLPSSADIKPNDEPDKGKTLADRVAALAGDLPEEESAAGVPAASDLSLAPAGTAVLTDDERAEVPAADIDTSGIELASATADPEPMADDAPPAPDTSHLSMGEVGEDIPHLEIEEELLDPDISHLSMGEVGEDIPHLEIEQELLDPDTSSISLAPEGSDVLEEEYKHKDEARAPDTDHLALEDQPP